MFNSLKQFAAKVSNQVVTGDVSYNFIVLFFKFYVLDSHCILQNWEIQRMKWVNIFSN